MILITTQTGDIGARVIAQVLDAGEPVRVIVRDATKLSGNMPSWLDIIEGSHADAAVIGPALDGVDRVFWLPPGNPTEPSADHAYVTFSQAFADALQTSDVSHVVGISALGRGWAEPAGLVSASLAMDDLIGATGVAYRALTCASLMDNLMRQIDPIRDGAFFAPTPRDLKLPHVAKSDVAAVASRLLLSPDWQGVEEIPLYGPEDLSFDEMAETLSALLKSPIAFHEMSMDAFAEMMRSIGTSEGMARDYVDMMTAKNNGMDKMHPDALRHDTPTTFRSWAMAELKPAVLNWPHAVGSGQVS